MVFFVGADDAPKIVAGNMATASFAHGFYMKERGGGIFSAEVGGDAVVIAGFGAVKNHEIFGEDLVVAGFSDKEERFVVFGEGGKLFFEEAFGKSVKFVSFGGFELDFVKVFDVFGVF